MANKSCYIRINIRNYYTGFLVPKNWELYVDQNLTRANIYLKNINIFRVKLPRSLKYKEENNFFLIYFVSAFYSNLTLLWVLVKISKEFFFSRRYFFFNILKAHGINMRFKLMSKNLLFLRLGFSHGFFIKIPQQIFFKVYRRRYILVVGSNEFLLNNLLYHIRYFRRFFDYKLIGVKFLQDHFKIKVGKKKAF